MLFFAKLLFSGLALWWGLSQVNFQHLCLVFKELPLGIYVSAYLMMCVCISLNGLRLYYIAQKFGIKQSFKTLHSLTWIGMFFNQLLPGGIGGDAYRIYTLSRHNSTLLGSATIIWDRILGMIFLSLVSASLLYFVNLPESLKITNAVIYSLLLGGVIVLGLFIRYPILQKYKVVNTMWKIFAKARILIKAPLTGMITTSLALALANCSMFYLLIVALNIPLNFAESSVMLTLSLLIVLIPISISGWGLREGFLTAYFTAIGLPAELGFTLGVLQGLVMIATGAIGAGFYLFTKKLQNPLAKNKKIDSIKALQAGVAQG